MTWNVPEGVPDSTLYVRAYAMCEKADGTLVRCAYGNSPGFIEVRACACIRCTPSQRFTDNKPSDALCACMAVVMPCIVLTGTIAAIPLLAATCSCGARVRVCHGDLL